MLKVKILIFFFKNTIIYLTYENKYNSEKFECLKH
jgi:hypothetical protein